jgi:WD40 repeat protein/serine/threonine protein kinase
MISFVCPGCGKRLQVKDELAGRKARCPGCSLAVNIPEVSPERTASCSPAAKLPTWDEVSHHTLPVGHLGEDSKSPDTPGGDTFAAAPRGVIRDPYAELTDFLAPAQMPDELGRLGPYRVLAVLGRGGMGVVFRAEDPQLERQVALKAMLPSLATSPSAKERFFREAKAAAALKHPHVVTIHQVGEDRGAPFLAMEFLEGESLDDRLKREGKLPVPEILRIGREAAKGLGAAHDRGLIHRDIKPANMWLEGDEGHVKILDFGLARAVADQTHLTQSGTIIGTPAYMAPEQCGGGQVDHRSDLFSLGCVLYRMCSGELPFKGADTLAILSALALETPKPLPELNPSIPAPLSDLVMRLLAKKPEERPRTAQEVAEELETLAEDHTTVLASPAKIASGVRGRPVVRAVRGTADPKPSANRARVALTVAAGLVLLICLAGGWFLFRGTPTSSSERAETKTVAQPRQVEGPLARLQRKDIPPYELAVAGGGDGGKAPRELVAILGDSRLMHWSGVSAVAFSPDGRQLVSADNGGTVKVWDAATGKEIHNAAWHDRSVHALAVQPDGQQVASGCESGKVVLWVPASGRHVTLSAGFWCYALRLCFSPDGATLVAGFADGTLKFFDVKSARETGQLKGHEKGVTALEFSRDGRLLASASDDGSLVLRESSTGKPLRQLTGHEKQVRALAFSADGELLAAGDDSGAVKTWETSSGRPRQSAARQGGGTFALAFGEGGRLLAASNAGRSLLAWEPLTNNEVAHIPDGNLGRSCGVFSPDGGRLAFCNHPSLRIWDLAGRKELDSLSAPEGHVTSVALDQDNRVLASGTGFGFLSLWDPESLPKKREERVGSWLAQVAVSRDGATLATAGDRAGVWDRKTGAERFAFSGHTSWVQAVAFAGSGQRVASGSLDGTIKIWKVADGELVRTLKVAKGWVTQVAFSPDGRLVATEGEDKAIKLWETATGAEKLVLTGHTSGITGLAFHPDGKTLASASNDNSIRLWDLQTSKELRILRRSKKRYDLRSVVFSPDGQQLAFVEDGAVHVWDSAATAELASIRLGPPTGVVAQVAYGADSRHLVTANGNGTVYILRLDRTPP